MRTTLVAALAVFLFGCGEAPADMNGEWSYDWALSAPEPPLRGALTLTEDAGGALGGRLGLPDSYPAGQTWDFSVAGTRTDLQILTQGVVSWSFRCETGPNHLACDGTQVDDGRGSTFVATRD